MSKSKSRENWAKRSSSFVTHREEKERIEKLKQDPKLQERINNPIYL